MTRQLFFKLLRVLDYKFCRVLTAFIDLNVIDFYTGDDKDNMRRKFNDRK